MCHACMACDMQQLMRQSQRFNVELALCASSSFKRVRVWRENAQRLMSRNARCLSAALIPLSKIPRVEFCRSLSSSSAACVCFNLLMAASASEICCVR